MGGMPKVLLASLREATSNGIENTMWGRAEKIRKRRLKQAKHLLDMARMPAVSKTETRHRRLGEERIGQRRKHKKANVSPTELEPNVDGSLSSSFSEEVSVINPQDEEIAAEDPTASEESGTSSPGDERDIHEPNLRVEETIKALDDSNVKPPKIPLPIVEYGCTFRAQVSSLRALGDRIGPRRPRDAGPLYGGRCRWSPYPSKRRHSPAAECTEDDLFIDDATTEAAPELEPAPEADDLPFIDDATANAALEQERALEADDANEVPAEEQLALHIAAGKAKVSAWWKALADARDARAAAAFTAGYQEPSAVEDTYYALFNAPMPDDLDEDSVMSGMEDAWLPDAPPHTRLGVRSNGSL